MCVCVCGFQTYAGFRDMSIGNSSTEPEIGVGLAGATVIFII